MLVVVVHFLGNVFGGGFDGDGADDGPGGMMMTAAGAHGRAGQRLRGPARRQARIGERYARSGRRRRAITTTTSARRTGAGKGLLFDARFEGGFVVAVEVEQIYDVHQFVLAGVDRNAENVMQKIQEVVGKLTVEVGDGILVTFRGGELLVMRGHHASADSLEMERNRQCDDVSLT